ncbi:DUF4214 domain-containing protein [Massilia sp. W12]|uniref:DUF4214 domain-containing protein n=1 Tax=Massilia sp. W12 TaxID=3126507 RepID=UPI0030D141C4
MMRLPALFCFLLALLCLPTPRAQAAESHPRLWLNSSDVSRLRSWATQENPFWRDALLPLAQRAKAEMDRGDVPGRDCGSTEYESYPAEMYAELFAFMSLIEADAAVRADYAGRARTLLLGIMRHAALGPSEDRSVVCAETGSADYPPYRSPRFFTEDSNRARWHGEAFPLVVDWIYPYLNSEDKTLIRSVFLRWAQEIVERGYHRPEPIGVVNSPTLLENSSQVRWSGNNYFVAHMRNLGMLALSFDAADDANNQLRNYLGNATGAWLYIFDHLTRGDARGGLLPEGYEYSPQTASYAVQFLLALKTAGADTCGRHCRLAENPFWDDFLISYYHSLSPAPTTNANQQRVFLPAWYGDGENYQSSDFISAFGAMGAYDYLDGRSERLASLRWAQTHLAPGGAAGLTRRASNPEDFRQAILYFMLFDPNVVSIPEYDPRSSLPLSWFATGLHTVLARNSWSADASWFSYQMSWNHIDHQQAAGGNFEWYHNGEWLTKARNGYPDIAEGIASSEFKNALTIENSRPNRDANDWRIDLWQRGSQWNLLPSGDPQWLASSHNRHYQYVHSDNTNLYNASNEGVNDVRHASRALLWLPGEALFVFDRAETASANRFKRWWLQLANPATIEGKLASSRTAGNQTLWLHSLLPQNAVLTAVNTNEQHIENTAARGDLMRVRLRVDAPDNPQALQFLHKLSVGGNAASAQGTLVQSSNGAWSGATHGDTLVMFPHNVQGEAGFSYDSSASRHIITGLRANSAYSLSRSGNTWMLSSGGALQSDAGGVLHYPQGNDALLSLSLQGNGVGLVMSDPAGVWCGTACSATFAPGASVSLRAVAASGSVFSGWSGACSGAASTCTVSMSAAQSVSASFAASGGGAAPGAPTLLRTQPAENGAQLYFSAPTDSGGSALTGYLAACTANGQSTRSASGAASPLRIELSAGIIWRCSVQAQNSAGAGSASNALAAQALGAGALHAVNVARSACSQAASGNDWQITCGAQTFTASRAQRVQFSDGQLAFDTEGNAGKVYRLYQAAFDRQPDAAGLGFHLATIEKYGLNLEGVARNFVQSQEFSDRYGSLDNNGFVAQLYQNVLHRPADAGGLAFWVNILNTGAGTRFGVLVGFSESAENKSGVAAAIANGISFTPWEQ